MEPHTHANEPETRTLETTLHAMERAGLELEKAGKKRNAALASAIGGGFLAWGASLLDEYTAFDMASVVRTATSLLAVLWFVQANRHEVAGGRLLKGQKPVSPVQQVGLFSWLWWGK